MKKISAVSRTRKVIGRGKTGHSGRGFYMMDTVVPLNWTVIQKLEAAFKGLTECDICYSENDYYVTVSWKLKADVVTDEFYRDVTARKDKKTGEVTVEVYMTL